jgi:hypothetical protein
MDTTSLARDVLIGSERSICLMESREVGASTLATNEVFAKRQHGRYAVGVCNVVVRLARTRQVHLAGRLKSAVGWTVQDS